MDEGMRRVDRNVKRPRVSKNDPKLCGHGDMRFRFELLG